MLKSAVILALGGAAVADATQPGGRQLAAHLDKECNTAMQAVTPDLINAKPFEAECKKGETESTCPSGCTTPYKTAVAKCVDHKYKKDGTDTAFNLGTTPLEFDQAGGNPDKGSCKYQFITQALASSKLTCQNVLNILDNSLFDAGACVTDKCAPACQTAIDKAFELCNSDAKTPGGKTAATIICSQGVTYEGNCKKSANDKKFKDGKTTGDLASSNDSCDTFKLVNGAGVASLSTAAVLAVTGIATMLFMCTCNCQFSGIVPCAQPFGLDNPTCDKLIAGGKFKDGMEAKSIDECAVMSSATAASPTALTLMATGLASIFFI